VRYVFPNHSDKAMFLPSGLDGLYALSVLRIVSCNLARIAGGKGEAGDQQRKGNAKWLHGHILTLLIVIFMVPRSVNRKGLCEYTPFRSNWNARRRSFDWSFGTQFFA
jgi:hypothetical protein